MTCLQPVEVMVWGFKLQRICCDRKLKQAAKTCKVEKSLKHSKQSVLNQVLITDNVNIEDTVNTVMKIKSVSPESHPQFSPSLHASLCQICGYRQLQRDIDALRKIAYSSEDSEHEQLLMQLWTALRPNEALEKRICRQWTDIGFQGDDPATDFRGMGILGLHNLVFFVTQYTECARQMVSTSQHPQFGYSFAIVGINITFLTYQLMIGGHLKTHFYNTVHTQPTIEHFHQAYCCLLAEFGRFWVSEKPRDIMEFNRIKSKFQKKITLRLKDYNASLSDNVLTSQSLATPTSLSTPL